MTAPISAPRTIRLQVKYLLDQARQASGLDDFGDPWFMRPLQSLVDMVNAECGLTAADADPVQRIVANLIDRLRLVRYLHDHPQARDETIDVGGVIIGWPRGGSTLLQRLLAASPQLTGAYWWELINPLPLSKEGAADRAERKQIAIDTVKALYESWPEMESQHPLRPLDVDEEVLLFDRSFMSITWAVYFHIPSYIPWLNANDQSLAYEELLLWLKVLTHQQPERRGQKWILKSPHHLLGGGLRHALAAMPDAKLIMTHRALHNVATSYASIAETTMKDWSSTYDRKAVGRGVIAMFQRCIDHLMEIRADPDLAARFVDVRFQDTFERPMEVFARVLRQMGLSVGEDDMAAAQTWMAANGRETHPPHRYNPEDYGMRAEEIDQVFAEYHRQFLS